MTGCGHRREPSLHEDLREHHPGVEKGGLGHLSRPQLLRLAGHQEPFQGDPSLFGQLQQSRLVPPLHQGPSHARDLGALAGEE